MWPWVSRARYEDAQREIERLRQQNSEQSERIVTLTAENAVLVSEPARETENSEDIQPVRGRLRLDQIRARANQWAAAQAKLMKPGA